MTHPSPDAFRLLCVCTGNVFRSRIAAHWLRTELADRLGERATVFEVSSAGAGVLDGRPVHPTESAALERWGLPADHRPSHRLTVADIEGADLVLGADRSHIAAVLDLVPAAHRRTFGLREFSRVAGPSVEGAAAGRADVHGVDFDPLDRARYAVACAAAFRGHAFEAARDDIPDPWGRSDDVLCAAAELVRSAVPGVVDALTAGFGPTTTSERAPRSERRLD